jgi:hypothetical protein
MGKPLVIQIREVKANIIECINEAIRDGLPCFLLEPIIAEVHSQISGSAQAEYEQAQAEYEQAQKTPTHQETKNERGDDNGCEDRD